MPTFTIYDIPYLRSHHDRVKSAQQAAAGTTTQPIRMQHSAADSITLRGIPAVGRSVAGCIRGTNPLAEALRDR